MPEPIFTRPIVLCAPECLFQCIVYPFGVIGMEQAHPKVGVLRYINRIPESLIEFRVPPNSVGFKVPIPNHIMGSTADNLEALPLTLRFLFLLPTASDVVIVDHNAAYIRVVQEVASSALNPKPCPAFVLDAKLRLECFAWIL